MAERKPAIICLLVLSLAGAALAQDSAEPDRQWQSVVTLHQGTDLAVRMKGGKRVEGKVVAASDTTLTIENKAGRTDSRRVDVSDVYLVKGRPIGKSILIASLIGAGVGVAIGIPAGSCRERDLICFGRPLTVSVLGATGAAMGAGVGALIGLSHHAKVSLYRAK